MLFPCNSNGVLGVCVLVGWGVRIVVWFSNVVVGSELKLHVKDYSKDFPLSGSLLEPLWSTKSTLLVTFIYHDGSLRAWLVERPDAFC